MTRWFAWGLWLAILGSFGVVLAGSGADEDGPGSAIAYTVFVLAFATVGALVATRQPRNPMGWILMGAGASYSIGGLTVTHVEGGGDDPLITWVSTWIWLAGIGPVATFGLLLFPDGRLPSRRWRPLGLAAGASIALVIAGIALEPGRFDAAAAVNPFGLDALPGLPGVMEALGAAGLAVSIAGSVLSVFARFRRARSIERQQLKWLSYAGGLVVASLAFALVLEGIFAQRVVDVTNTIVSVALATVPAAMGIAILRHRLYDIDLVIRRTLVYGVLTATLGASYLGCVLLAQLVIGAESDLAIAVSTLAVAALFRPALARIQALVDRRFYRRRYDAELTLASFSGRLRDEVDLEALSAHLSGAVRETVQPAHVSLWLRR